MGIKIINISSIPEGPLTVDTTLVTADNTNITADQTVYLVPGSNDHELKIIPRYYETELTMHLWNEFKQEETVLECTGTIDEGYLIIPFTLYMTEGESFETKVFDSTNRTVWRGKLYATSQTDLQNFTLNPPGNNNIIVI